MSNIRGASASAYDASSKPSPNSTPLARFNSGRPPIPTSSPLALRAFSEARCEIKSNDLPLAINMGISGSVLAVQGVGGYKNREPTLYLYNIASPEHFWSLQVDVGLSGIAYHMQMDGERKLVYVADENRVKSYWWNFDDDKGAESMAVHTLESSAFRGAMALRENGSKLLRSGYNGIIIWDIGTLQTHGKHGEDIVGNATDPEFLDTWRDDREEIELSTGSPPTQNVTAPALAKIAQWVENPSESKEMIVAYKEQYGVVRINLETQQVVSRYVGHGAHVNRIRTSAADAHSFVTAANDGVVRLYDVRMPAPILAVEHNREFINSCLYEHIGGQPCKLNASTPISFRLIAYLQSSSSVARKVSKSKYGMYGRSFRYTS